ncbi:hypothetical protein C8R44DRAFT_31265 [Mycena epipterygia]|nr:hypothetical protein C8R44DRAFT_31265 [Mycena epipterygia]
MVPNLREVILTNENFTYSSPSIVLPWGQITHYHGTYTSQRQLQILQSATNLLECDIGFYDWSGALENEVIILHLLHRLHLEEGGFLVHLTTPLLRSLFVDQNLEQGVLLPFIRRSSCRLTKSLPTLTYLLLQITSTDEQEADQTDLFNAMCITDTSSDLCPNLRSMLYGYSKFSDFLEDAFFAMAQSRFQTPHRLQILRVFCGWHHYKESAEARIEILRDEGFDAAFWEYHEVQAELANIYSS